jgi:hypothetical protein
MRIFRQFSSILTLLVLSAGAAMADTTTFECSYRSYSDEAGNHAVKGSFKLTFLIDTKADKAYLIGNNGSSEVVVILNDDGGLTLVETTASGNVMVTVIAAKEESVHSRNGIMNGKIIPSQYYGKCVSK